MLRRVISSSKITATHFYAFQRALSTESIQKQYTYSDDVKTSIFDGKDLHIAKSALINNFTAGKEPLCYHISPRNFDFCVKPYLDQAVKDKLSIVVEVSNVFAGISINNDFTFIEDDQFIQDLKKRDWFGFDMIFQIERELNHDFRHEMHNKDLFQHGNILRMLLVGVDPHYEHRGFATYLAEKSAERAKQMGYKYMTAACTNDHIRHATEKVGFECINTIQYDKWEYPKDSGLFPKKGIQQITGFKEMSFMVKQL